MVRESGISATGPTFANYILPILKHPFTRRRSSASSYTADTATSANTTPANSPPMHEHLNKSKLSRVAPDVLRCQACSCDLAFASQIVSKGFTGRHGPAMLVAPPAAPAEQTLLNIRLGRNESRQLVTGSHVVADISCNMCSTKIGWKYIDARESSQKYKVGKFILETALVVTSRSWEDTEPSATKHAAANDSGEDEDDVALNSEDEDELEDLFAGTWDAQTVANRRNRIPAHVSTEE